MDTQELRTLKLLEEIEGDQAPSQRDLSTRLNISLGLVNSFMKRLTQKGYFKITNIPKNRVKYILTPKGAAEKTRLTYEYIQYSFQFYKDTRRKLKDVFRQFEKQRIERIIFWGVGELTEIAYLSLQGTQIKLVAVVDAQTAGEKFLGLRIISPHDIEGLSYERILVTSMDSTGGSMKVILSHGVPRSAITLLS